MRILLILFCGLLILQSAISQPMRVMTYNLRLDVASDGVNQWGNRKEKVFSLLKQYDPDFIGVQEAMHHQLAGIKTNLPQYESIGVGRDDGITKGEYSAILYKKDKFEVLMQNTSWLSLTPQIPGSKSWDAAVTRVVTFGWFKNKTTGETFYVLNTHFDHMGLEARKNSAALLRDLIASLRTAHNDPVILTGDFNSEKSEATYTVLSDLEAMKDTRPAHEQAGTFCNFGVNSMVCKAIDYIFVSHTWNVMEYKIITDNDGTYYPSDHLPVMVSLTRQ